MITSVEKIYSKGTFDSYKMIKGGVEWSVPLAEDNTHYQEIQEWAKIEGNNIIDNGA
tara:strand:- start:4248 stop:4418 length:171 start_codon:yes stop_codon:yes gene_type:complete